MSCHPAGRSLDQDSTYFYPPCRVLSIQFVYRCETDDFESVETNIKEERVNEAIGEWLRTQIGAGKDESEPVERKQYSVRIELDLSDDSFAVRSDTGNKGLTTGLVMHL